MDSGCFITLKLDSEGDFDDARKHANGKHWHTAEFNDGIFSCHFHIFANIGYFSVSVIESGIHFLAHIFKITLGSNISGFVGILNDKENSSSLLTE